jgi:spermidine/putrescine transport system ATP-binding protein
VSDGRVAIALEDVRKSFGDVDAVRGVSLDIREGEFLTFLGPSGCGKTTTLRMIAGFEEPDSGRIFLRGRDVVGVPPNRREVNMVFQHYALFPHMTVEDNVAYGLKLKKVPKADRHERVRTILEAVRLEGYQKRRPRQLSGGQQQRVALARALVNEPAALLLDEPLGALDVKLRKQMQLELKLIQNELGTTFVYVTHDQEEALLMSDRIAVMNQGVVEQIGSAREIYERPATPFVADFVGVLNEMEIRVDEVRDGAAVMRLGDGERIEVPMALGASLGERLTAAVRPERVRIESPAAADNGRGSRIRGEIALIVYLGTLTQFHVDTSVGTRLIAHRLSNDLAAEVREGEQVVLAWDTTDASVLDPSHGSGDAAEGLTSPPSAAAGT